MVKYYRYGYDSRKTDGKYRNESKMMYKARTGRTYSSRQAAKRKQAERLNNWKMLTVATVILIISGLLTTWTM